MKKNKGILILIMVLSLLVLVAGCKKKEEDIVSPGNDIGQTEDNIETDEKSTEEFMEEFDELVANNDIDNVIRFMSENMKNFTSIEADKMVLGLERLLDNNLLDEEELLIEYDSFKLGELSDFSLFFPEEKINSIEDGKLKKEIERLYNSKYRLINLEGDYYPIIDYAKFKEYNSYVSDEIKEYIDIMADTNENPIAIDGGLYISYDELADRIIKVEKYLNKYGNGKKSADILNMYEWWLDIYLIGLPNSPIDDFETGMINEDVFNSYKKTATIKDSATAFIVSKYIGMIDDNKGKITDDLLYKGSQLVHEALDLVDISK